MSLGVRALLYVVIVALFGYPVAALAVHGLDPGLWPAEVIAPGTWFDALRFLHLGTITNAYWRMALNRSPAFAGGFWALLSLLAPLAMVAGWRLWRSHPQPREIRRTCSARPASRRQLSVQP